MGSSSPIFGVKIKHIRNHHLAILRTPRFFPTQPTDLTNRHESSNLRHRIHFFQLPKFAAIFHQKVPPWLLMATGNPAVAPVEIGSLSHEFTGIQKPSKRWWLLDFWTINSTKAAPQRNPPSSSSGFVLDPYSAQRNAAKTTTKKIHG